MIIQKARSIILRTQTQHQAASFLSAKLLGEKIAIRALSSTAVAPAASAASSNAATPVSHAHSQHWTAERVMSVGILAALPISLYLEMPAADYLLAAILALHSHWGMRAITTDYFPNSGIVAFLVYASSILTFLGLCYFNYADMGISKAAKKVWAL